MWLLFALLSGFFASVLALIIKLYLKHLNPFFITFFFSFIVLIALFMIDCVSRKINCGLILKLSSQEWLFLIIAGCLNGLAFTCYMSALKCGKICNVVAIDRLGILFVVILSVIFLKESFSIKSIIGSIMMIAGATLLSS